MYDDPCCRCGSERVLRGFVYTIGKVSFFKIVISNSSKATNFYQKSLPVYTSNVRFIYPFNIKHTHPLQSYLHADPRGVAEPQQWGGVSPPPPGPLHSGLLPRPLVRVRGRRPAHGDRPRSSGEGSGEGRHLPASLSLSHQVLDHWKACIYSQDFHIPVCNGHCTYHNFYVT